MMKIIPGLEEVLDGWLAPQSETPDFWLVPAAKKKLRDNLGLLEMWGSTRGSNVS